MTRLMRERWLGATGRKVPEIAVEGEIDLPLETLVLDERRRPALEAARTARAGLSSCAPSTAENVKAALARPGGLLRPRPGRRSVRFSISTSGS